MNDLQERIERGDPNLIKVRLPHGEWVWVDRLTGFSTEGGTGTLLNEPVAACGLHHGMQVAFVVKGHDGSDYYALDWDGEVPTGDAP